MPPLPTLQAAPQLQSSGTQPHLKAGDVVFDVGANIGLFTLSLCELSVPAGGSTIDTSARAPSSSWMCPYRVFAFEPLPPTFSLCQHNLEACHLPLVIDDPQDSSGPAASASAGDTQGYPVTLLQAALSNVAGDCDFTFYPSMVLLSVQYLPFICWRMAHAVRIQLTGFLT